MKRIMKHLQLPSGLQSGLPMVIDDDWSTEQVVAVTELLQDLLHVIHSRYQGELYDYWEPGMRSTWRAGAGRGRVEVPAATITPKYTQGLHGI